MDQDDREQPLPIWKVTRDDQGNAVLGWTPESHRADPDPECDTDELAQTYSYLKRLEIDDLSIEGEELGEENGGDPYDTGSWKKIAKPTGYR